MTSNDFISPLSLPICSFLGFFLRVTRAASRRARPFVLGDTVLLNLNCYIPPSLKEVDRDRAVQLSERIKAPSLSQSEKRPPLTMNRNVVVMANIFYEPAACRVR